MKVKEDLCHRNGQEPFRLKANGTKPSARKEKHQEINTSKGGKVSFPFQNC